MSAAPQTTPRADGLARKPADRGGAPRGAVDSAQAAALRRSFEALQAYAGAADPDARFLIDMQARIDGARRDAAAHAPPRRLESASHALPFRILLLGYTGPGNTGADLRTVETIAQIRHLFASYEVALTLFALGTCFDHPLLAATPKCVPARPYLPDALDLAIRDADMVINVEGSTYTSTFSDSLSGILIGGALLARAHGRIALAYGVDSGAMSAPLTAFVARNAHDAGQVICRNDAACEQLATLGIAALRGADTAWTYRARTPSRARAAHERVVVLCPNNPFWWPVRPDAARAGALDASGETDPHRYGPLHFHRWDAQRAQSYQAYLATYAAIAIGLRARGYTPVLVGMEPLDRHACADMAARLPFAVEQVVRASAGHTLDDVAGTVARADGVVTTRYHAAVLAVSHGVPVFGLSMDSRIDRLLSEAQCAAWYAPCDADDLTQRCLAQFDTLQPSGARAALALTLRRYARAERKRMTTMGQTMLALALAS